jgi:hypothetical protein
MLADRLPSFDGWAFSCRMPQLSKKCNWRNNLNACAIVGERIPVMGRLILKVGVCVPMLQIFFAVKAKISLWSFVPVP